MKEIRNILGDEWDTNDAEIWKIICWTYNGNHGDRAKDEEHYENRQSDADVCDYECLMANGHTNGEHNAHGSYQTEEHRHCDPVLHNAVRAKQRAKVKQLWVDVIQRCGHTAGYWC